MPSTPHTLTARQVPPGDVESFKEAAKANGLSTEELLRRTIHEVAERHRRVQRRRALAAWDADPSRPTATSAENLEVLHAIRDAL